MKNLFDKKTKQAYDLLKKVLDNEDIEPSKKEENKNISLKELSKREYEEWLRKQ